MDELISRINTVTTQYLERFGRTRVAVYHLVMAPEHSFSSFLNSLMITLRRKDLMPCYFWFSTAAPDSRYLILWCNGYFKTDLSDINQIAAHQAALHFLKSFCTIECLIGDISQASVINTRLISILSSCYLPLAQYHQRSFGASAPL